MFQLNKHKILNNTHRIILVINDALIVWACFWAGHELWLLSPQRLNPNPHPIDFSHIILYSLLFNMIMLWGGTYKIQSSVAHVVRLRDLIKFTVIGFIFALIIGFFSKSLIVGRLQAFYTFLLIVPAILFSRGLLDELWNRLVTKRNQKNVVIYGAGDTGKRLAKTIAKHPKLGMSATAFFDDNKKSCSVVMANALPVYGGIEEFKSYLTSPSNKIEEVLIAMPSASSQQIMEIMEICEQHSMSYRFVPSFNELALHRLQQDQIDGIPLFGPREMSIPVTNRIVKRVFDVLISVMTLMMFSPLIGLIAWWIKRGSEGPVIFVQKRVGLKGKEFELYKFRTMYTDSPKYARHPQDSDDPRITKVGRYLRKTSLDELPQFWNVLKGDMSIVGPRPEMPFIVKEYNDIQSERLNAKPGITGIWQISGDRSYPIHENVDHDLYYIEHQSVLLDFVIILQTIWFAVIRGVGAR